MTQAKSENSPVDPAIVAADNAFGLNLLNTLLQVDSTDNTAIAPLSVALALQIVYNGAVGATQQAMAQTLQLGGLSVSQLNSDNAALQASLLDADPQVDLTVANSLWVHTNTYTVAPAFVSMDQNYYGAELGDLGGAPANVNSWVGTQTNGLIPQVLSPKSDYSRTVALLVNVMYFKGQWASEFSVAQTAAAPFTLADGTQTSVPMMRQIETIPYFQGTNFQAVSVPYGQGRLSMLIVLPNPGVALDSFVAAMTPSDIDTWVSRMESSASVDLRLPRFSTSFGAFLVEELKALGMGSAFDPNQAGLAGIYPGGFISEVDHKTVVEVNETGTVATDVTVVGVRTTVVQQSFDFEADHPFFYAIRDNATGDLLFVGVLRNPNGG
ncbi:MAG TPA: serpin family protein [Steroidobacteraceae bacterium]